MRNDLKAAVEYFESLIQTIADDEWNRETRSSATAALTALREKQQREAGCLFCEDGEMAEKTRANYCFNCGRKLAQ